MFGSEIVIDGATAVITAPQDTELMNVNGVVVRRRRWSIHLFDVGTGTLVRTIRDPAPSPDDSSYASHVAADGGLIAVVGSGVDVFVFDAASGELRRRTQIAEIRAVFGSG